MSQAPQATTKSGTDTFYCSAWVYFRNDALDANNYFATVNTHFGAIYLAGIKNQNVFMQPSAIFTFNRTRTDDPAADYILGPTGTYHQDSGSFHYRQGEAHGQDDWHVSRS